MNHFKKVIPLGLVIVFGTTVTIEAKELYNNGDGQYQMQKRRGMGRNMPTFTEFDLNADGKIVENEFYDARNKRIAKRVKQGYKMRNLGNAPSFKALDTNKEGQLNSKEFSQHHVMCRHERNR